MSILDNPIVQSLEKRLVASGVRAALNWIGPLLIAHGFATEQAVGGVNIEAVVSYIVGVALPALALMWSDRDGKKTAEKIAVAAALPAGTPESAVVNAVATKTITTAAHTRHYEFKDGKVVIVE